MEKSKPDKPKWEVDEIGADILPIFVGILQCAGMTDFFVMYKGSNSLHMLKKPAKLNEVATSNLQIISAEC